MKRNFVRILFLMLIVFSGHLRGKDLRQQIDSTNAIPYEFVVSNALKSIDIFEKNAEIARSISYKYGEARALENLLLAYYVIGKLDKQADVALRAIKIYEEIGRIPELASLYGRYGYNLRKHNFPRAKEYMKKGIRLAEEHNLKHKLSVLYDDYGVLHEEKNNLDSALYYYQRALKVKTELQDSIGIPYSLNNIAGIYGMKKQFRRALEYAARSDAYRRKEKGEFGRALNLVLYGEIYRGMGKLDSALVYFKRCLQKSLALQFTDLTRYCYMQLTSLYEDKKDYRRALENQKKYIAYKDSLLNVATNTRIAELEIAYETEKKDLRIAQNELELRRKTNLLVITLGAIGVLLIFVFGIYRFQKLKRIQLQKELELKNRLRQSELEKTLSEEKLRIARELHDNIGFHLTFMISAVDNLEYAITEKKAQEKLARISSFGRETLMELRNTIWAMKHEGGELNDLVLKINELKRQIQTGEGTPKIEVISEVRHARRLSSVQMLNLYRIVQEAVQNALKYARAERIQVRFSENSGSLVLTVSDDGIGFDPNSVASGNGLSNMRHRCRAVGGEFEISSTPGSGTTVICRIPGEQSKG